MQKRVAVLLFVVVFFLVPSVALGEETRSVSDLCLEASEAQTPEAMSGSIHSAFEAMKVEAQTDVRRKKEVTPTVLNLATDDDAEYEALEFPVCTITRGGKTMQYLIEVKGEPDESGYPLYITLSTRADKRDVSSFYWLKADKSVNKGQVIASFDAGTNTFTLSPSDDVNGDFSVLINPHMVDVRRPVTFQTANGSSTMRVSADPTTVETSLREVTDPYLAWVQEISYAELQGEEEPESGTSAPALVGTCHLQTYGNRRAVASGDGIMMGTTGESRRLESFGVRFADAVDGGISYRGHVQGIGWTGWRANGAACGTTGQAKRLEAVEMRLKGGVASTHSVWYRVHSQTFGWLGWAHDGEAAGTTGLSKRAEAVELQILPIGQMPIDYDAGIAACVSG